LGLSIILYLSAAILIEFDSNKKKIVKLRMSFSCWPLFFRLFVFL
jgi:hypothetical protein